MNNLIERAKYALQGEDAGPTVEQIIGLAVALIMGTGLILLANTAYKWITGASEQIDKLDKGGEGLHKKPY